MKNKITLKLVLIVVLAFLHTGLKAIDKNVSIKETLSQNADIYVFDGKTATKSIQASGVAEFTKKTGFVRVILTDNYGLDYLIYESSPLTATDGKEVFTNEDEETRNVSQVTCAKIRVEISNAELSSLTIMISDQVKALKSNMQRNQQQDAKITKINSNLEKMNALWRAGETSSSNLTYQEKKDQFGEGLDNLNGYEYYIGGIFENDPSYYFETRITPDNSLYVDEFDWRNRHGADNPSSPYYNAGGIGWLTSGKDQGRCASCWAFSTVGAIEAMANLYFNRFLNLDLSEQQLVSCLNRNCYGGFVSEAFDYIMKNGGIIDEASFPYTEMNTCQNCEIKTACDKLPQSYKEKINISRVEILNPSNADELKRRIINNGPLAGSISTLSHAMVLFGYMTIKEGDVIKLSNLTDYKQAESITISKNDPRIGHTVWIFKQSYENTNVGDFRYYLLGAQPFSIFNRSTSIVGPITSVNHKESDIPCEDKDGDGYYYWGIGPKPAHCPSCPDEPDSDDSDPNIGPMNKYGHTIPILRGDTLVCPNLDYTYTYIMPFPANKDTSIPVKLPLSNFGKLSSDHIFIPKGATSGTVSVKWTEAPIKLTLHVGDIKRSIKVYYRSELIPQVKSYPEVISLDPPHISGQSTSYWLIPGRLSGSVVLTASDAMAMTENFLWEVDMNDGSQKDVKYGNTYQLDYPVSQAFRQIVIKVTPYRALPCEASKTIIIKRSNLKLTTTEKLACNGDPIQYTIEGFNDLAGGNCAMIEWSGEGCLEEMQQSCEGKSSCTFSAIGNGYGKVKVTIIPPLVDKYGDCVMFPDPEEWSVNYIHLESDQLWVGPNNIEEPYTEIDGIHIIKDPYYPNMYRLVPQNHGVEYGKGWWKNLRVWNCCLVQPSHNDLYVYVSHPEGNVIEIEYSSITKCQRMQSPSSQIFRFTDPDAKNMKLVNNAQNNIAHVGDLITYKIINIPEIETADWSYSTNLKIVSSGLDFITVMAIGSGQAWVMVRNIKIWTENDSLEELDYCYFSAENNDVIVYDNLKKSARTEEDTPQDTKWLVKTSVYSLMGTMVYSKESDTDIDIENLNLDEAIYIIVKTDSKGVISREKIYIKK